MLYSLNNKIDELVDRAFSDEVGEDKDSLLSRAEELQERIDEIEKLKEIVKQALNKVNTVGRAKEGLEYLVNNLDELDFKKVIYATYKPCKRFDDRLDNISINYVNTIIEELEGIEVESEYRHYDHPYLWNTLIRMVVNHGYSK